MNIKSIILKAIGEDIPICRCMCEQTKINSAYNQVKADLRAKIPEIEKIIIRKFALEMLDYGFAVEDVKHFERGLISELTSQEK